MIHPDELAKAIEMTGSRYAVCILLAKRARQIQWHQRSTSVGLGSSVRQALDDILARRIAFYLPAADHFDQRRLSGQAKPLLLTAAEAELSDYALLSLFALVRANVEDDGSTIVGKNYSIQAGISSTPAQDFSAQPFDIRVKSRLEKIPFDFLIHLVGHLKLSGDCQRRLYYDPLNPDLQLTEFRFRVLGSGSNLITVDCYHDRRWLRTVEFTFDSIDVEMKAVA